MSDAIGAGRERPRALKPRRPKVAFVSQPWESPLEDFPFGGIANWTYQVGTRLAGPCDVTVYARWRHGREMEEWDRGVRYRNLPAREFVRVLERLWRHVPGRGPLFASSLYNLVYAVKIAADLREHPHDIVHIPNFSQFTPIIRAANPGTKIVLHMRCEWLTQLDPGTVARRLGGVDLVLGCSDFVTEKIRRAFPRYAARCHTLYNGVDVDQFAVQPGAPSDRREREGKRVIYIGRLSPEKGVHVLLDAFDHVIARCPDARLDVVGPEAVAPLEYIVGLTDDPRVKALEAFYGESYLAQLQRRPSPAAAGQVHFSGRARPHPELADALRLADVFVHPAVCAEAFGMSVIEAMAAGVPVVVSRTGGLPEYVEHGRTGWLVEPGDARGLAAAIVHLLSNGELRAAIGHDGQALVRARFSWDHVAAGVLREYERLWNDAAGGPADGGDA